MTKISTDTKATLSGYLNYDILVENVERDAYQTCKGRWKYYSWEWDEAMNSICELLNKLGYDTDYHVYGKSWQTRSGKYAYLTVTF